MSEFLDILTHGRRLQSAVKELSTDELEQVKAKLENIIEKRHQQAEEEKQQAQEKLEKLAAIKQQMEDAGLDISDLQQVAEPKRKVSKKRPLNIP